MNPSERVTLLVLFPRKEDLRVEKFFVSRDYLPIVIRLESEDYAIDFGEDCEDLMVRIPSSPVSYLSGLPDEQQRRLLKPRLVLNHVRDDILAPSVTGEGTAWQVSSTAEVEMKKRTVEWVLDSLLAPEDAIWVNVYAGKHGTTEQSFCPGRYSLTGFEHALHTSPRLKEMVILNICLTYFSGGDNRGCRDCLTTRYLEEIERHGNGLEGMLRYIDELVKRPSNS